MASVKITIFDGAIPLLDEISKVSYGLGLDALDKSGTILRENTRAAFRSSEKHHWSMVVSKKTGKRRIVRTVDSQRLGQRQSHITGQFENPENMQSFITSYLMPKSLTMVVAGKHKSFRPKKYRDGKVIGSLGRVSGVSDATYGILKKLNDGDAHDPEYFMHNRKAFMLRFANAKYKPRRFIEKGRISSMAEIRNIMTSKLDMLIGKQINQTQIKPKKVS